MVPCSLVSTTAQLECIEGFGHPLAHDGADIGLASFPDGSVASVNWTLTGDDTKGDGTWMTYVNVALLDGSVLRYKATGSSKASGPITGSLTVLGGKGRFEGAKGDGSISGAHPPETGPNSYFDIVINIKK
jgi:hypothetical protein